MAEPGEICSKDFGAGMRIAYRRGTVDEQVIKPWMAQLHEPTREFQVDPEGVVLDIGAHIGAFTLFAGSRVPRGRVLAVEACRESYELLVRNVEMNGLSGVETAHLALSDRSGEIQLHHSPTGNWGHTITKATTDEGSEMSPTETLPIFMEKHGVERCSIAKFNCEGAEFPILMATPAEVLRRIDQMLVLYHLDLVDPRYNLEELEHHLEEAGFKLKRQETSFQRGRIIAHLAH